MSQYNQTHLLLYINSFIYLVSVFCAAVVTTLPISVVIEVLLNIQSKKVQWFAGSICTRDVKVTPSLLSEVPLRTLNGVDLSGNDPIPSLTLSQRPIDSGGLRRGVLFHWSGGEFLPIILTKVNRQLTELWPSQC